MKKTVIFYIIDILSVVSTVILLIVSIGASITSSINPHNYPLTSITGLLLPIIVPTAIVLIAYWIIKRSWAFLIPLTAIIININPILSNLQLRISTQNNIYSSAEKLTVLSYNIHEFSYNRNTIPIENIKNFISNENADIICFQEFDINGNMPLDEIIRQFSTLPYYAINRSSEEQIGMAIFSKLPILRWDSIDFENTGNGIMWADVMDTNNTEIRVINLHLQTTSINSSRSKSFGDIIDNLSENIKKRYLQTDSIKLLLDTTLKSKIVCGDFNDTPSSYTYKTILGEDLVDGFKESGIGFGGTFNGFGWLGRVIRIDYILHSSNFRSIKYTSPKAEWSDHFPVISELVYQN